MTGKNQILYTYDGVKWGFGAYDMDSTYGLYWTGQEFLTANNMTKFQYLATLHRVFELIRSYKNDELKARYTALRKGVMSEDNVITTFANFIGSIPKAVYDEDYKVWTTLPMTAVNNLSQIQDWYRRRVAVLDVEI